MDITKLPGKKIAILGFGKEGKSSLNFLKRLSCGDITIHDRNPIGDADIKCICGEQYLTGLNAYDVIFISPGISYYTPEIVQVREKITSQAQIFFENYKGKVIALSGTKGKSTTSSLINETLKNAGYKAKLVGNIGTPVLDEISLQPLSFEVKGKDSGMESEYETYDYIVYEMSSYMLEGLKKQNFLSILLNIYPDHLDWHQGWENYRHAKLSLLDGSKNILVGYQVGNYFSPQNTFGKSGKYRYEHGDFFLDDTIVFNDTGITLLGEHNRYNICAVLGVCDIIGIPVTILKKTLETFSPLAHRLENIGSYHGITFIDDAISTTPESTIEAIKTFGKNIDTIMLGGTDRGYQYEALVQFLEDYEIKNIVLFPPSGEKIKKLLDESYRILETQDMESAVKFAFETTKPGSICMLSTAAPSYSLWKNFEQKAQLFQKYVHLYGSI